LNSFTQGRHPACRLRRLPSAFLPQKSSKFFERFSRLLRIYPYGDFLPGSSRGQTGIEGFTRAFGPLWPRGSLETPLWLKGANGGIFMPAPEAWAQRGIMGGAGINPFFFIHTSIQSTI